MTVFLRENSNNNNNNRKAKTFLEDRRKPRQRAAGGDGPSQPSQLTHMAAACAEQPLADRAYKYDTVGDDI